MINRRTVVLASGAVAVAGAGLAYAGVRDMGAIEDYNAATAATRAPMRTTANHHEIIRYATLAANSHNTQPWRFRITDRAIEILPDLTRHLPAVDPDNHHLFVSLGCAAENMALAAHAQGQSGALRFNPDQDGAVAFDLGAGAPAEPTLFDAIAKRQSTRGAYDGKPVSAGDLQQLHVAASVPGVDLILITDRPRMERVRDLVVTGNSAQMADPAFMRELKAWLRFNPRQALRTGDGLFSATTGNPTLPAWLGPILLDLVFKPEAENTKYAEHIASSAGLAVFVAAKSDREHWVLAGRSCQRFALQATALGLKHAFINQPVEVARLRPELAALIGAPDRRPDLVMRFGYGPALPYSARRPVDAVLA